MTPRLALLLAVISMLCLTTTACDITVPDPQDAGADADADADALDADTPRELTLVTWNLENFPLASNTLERVTEIIPELGADLVAVQEISSLSAFTDLVVALDEYDGLIADDPGAEIYVGLLFRDSRISIIDDQTLFPDDWYAFPRPPLMARIEVSTPGGQPYDATVVVVHLKAQLDAESAARRRAACATLATWIDAQVASGGQTDIIVLGDWNDELTDTGDDNVFSALLDHPDQYSFLTLDLAIAGAYSYIPFQSFLDHVLVTVDTLEAYGDGSIEIVPLDITVPNYTYSISDHRPVKAVFEMP